MCKLKIYIFYLLISFAYTSLIVFISLFFYYLLKSETGYSEISRIILEISRWKNEERSACVVIWQRKPVRLHLK